MTRYTLHGTTSLRATKKDVLKRGERRSLPPSSIMKTEKIMMMKVLLTNTTHAKQVSHTYTNLTTPFSTRVSYGRYFRVSSRLFGVMAQPEFKNDLNLGPPIALMPKLTSLGLRGRGQKQAPSNKILESNGSQQTMFSSHGLHVAQGIPAKKLLKRAPACSDHAPRTVTWLGLCA